MNRLQHETSPYLLQHAENPIDWYPWGDAAFAAARERDCPILLSVGYSSCHWCHVMAHESFEDEHAAAVANERFVCVKVDREERPDVDAIYMEAVQRMTGHGGWPMTVFLTPDGRPFFGGTYFPNTPRPGMPSFIQVCEAVHNAWETQRDELLEQATMLTDMIRKSNVLPSDATGSLTVETFTEARARLVANEDAERGGFGRAPKFPMAMAIRYLLTEPRDPEGTRVALHALDAMAAGGIHDHVGGGFHRYSTDNEWLVPHFEKMLYDQATLLRAYSAAYAVTGDAHYRNVATGIVEYVLRDLADPSGGFYAAEDADSGGIEGAFYCWQPTELAAALGDDADAVRSWSAISEHPNFTDPHTGFSGSILHAANRDPKTPARIARALASLRKVRAQRTRPGLDTKVLLGWNAMFASALAEAATICNEPTWHAAASRNVTFLLHAFATGDGYARSWQAGVTRHTAVLEDVAGLLDACVTLGACGEPQFFDSAQQVARVLDTYSDKSGVGWFTTEPTTELIVRPRDITDNALPSGAALACDALARLAILTDDPTLAERPRALLSTLGPTLARHPLAFGRSLEAAQRYVYPARELVVIGTDASALAMRAQALGALGANDVCACAPASSDAPFPVFTGRVGAEAPSPRAYVCEHYTCSAPAHDPEGFGQQLVRTL